MKKILSPILFLVGVIFFASAISYLQVDNMTAIFVAFIGAALILYALHLFKSSRRGGTKNSRDRILEEVRNKVKSQYGDDDDHHNQSR